MKTSRRSFIKTGALTVIGTSLFSQALFAAKKKAEVIGIQLYSIREDMGKDALGTLKQLASMGYKNVEHANYVDRKFYGYSATEFKKILDDLGMKMPSGHTVLHSNQWDKKKKDFTDSWKYTIEDAATCGQKFVVSPSLEKDLRTYEPFMEFMEVFNKSGELCQKSGMKFGYHNHDFEFSLKLNNVTMFDLLMKNTDPDKVSIQLDIGNMYIAGAKAIDILNSYPGRFETIHVKDMIQKKNGAEGFESTILGEGLIDPEKVMKLSKKEGGTWVFIIEQESYQGIAPLDCVKKDLKIINSGA
ncbi:MAG: sugar phosphate isomerase/epimerase family protein [Bacteroidales bacterium]|nr:sugar phosphate isomerase/epimerase family protein [Bacteroidales bacterium]